VLHVAKNYSALKLPAKEDLNGVFIDIFSPRRKKKILSLMKEGLPIEVKELPRKGAKKAYLITKEMIPNDEEDGGKPLGRPGIYYDVSLGGLKHERLYVTVERSGQVVYFVRE